MNESTWLVAREGQRAGPFNQAALRQQADAGLLGPRDWVQLLWTDTWLPADSIEGLFQTATRPPLPGALAPEQDQAAEAPDRAVSRRFWLIDSRCPQGPFEVNQLFTRVAADRRTLGMPACPEGQVNWQPLRCWPEFGGLGAWVEHPAKRAWSQGAAACALAAIVGVTGALCRTPLEGAAWGAAVAFLMVSFTVGERRGIWAGVTVGALAAILGALAGATANLPGALLPGILTSASVGAVLGAVSGAASGYLDELSKSGWR
jgi:GYF domain 2